MIDVEQTSNELPEWAGGQGDLAPTRETLSLVRRAVGNGWEIPDQLRSALPALCAKIAIDEKKGDRERLRAVEILRSMTRDNVDAAQVVDKVDRLDSGQATDRIELGPIQWNPER